MANGSTKGGSGSKIKNSTPAKKRTPKYNTSSNDVPF